VLELGGLRDTAVTAGAAWEGETLLALGAMKTLGDGKAELKSMLTAPDQRRRRAAGAMLDHLIAEARGSGIARLSPETGSHPAFEPAHALYTRAGFVECPPFGAHTDTVVVSNLTREI
jgi:putative acetyltransferase